MSGLTVGAHRWQQQAFNRRSGRRPAEVAAEAGTPRPGRRGRDGEAGARKPGRGGRGAEAGMGRPGAGGGLIKLMMKLMRGNRST